MIKVLCSILIAIGIFIVIGTAGADCDGKCMERSLSLTEIAQWLFMGLTLIGLGALGLYRASE